MEEQLVERRGKSASSKRKARGRATTPLRSSQASAEGCMSRRAGWQTWQAEGHILLQSLANCREADVQHAKLTSSGDVKAGSAEIPRVASEQLSAPGVEVAGVESAGGDGGTMAGPALPAAG
eukprot:6173697-Pleurochrysis_carterae.AAC.4